MRFWVAVELLLAVADAGSGPWLVATALVLLLELADARDFEELGGSSKAGALRF